MTREEYAQGTYLIGPLIGLEVDTAMGWYMHTDSSGDLVIELDPKSNSQEIMSYGVSISEEQIENYTPRTDERKYLWIARAQKVTPPYLRTNPNHSYKSSSKRSKGSIQVGNTHITSEL